MGKMRFKLSHVMPHAWFFKLKEVGKPGSSLAYQALEPATSAYANPPINHKLAMDIPFPAADTLKESPPVDPAASAEDIFSSLAQLHLIELSVDDDDESRPSIVLPHISARRLDQHNIIPASADAANRPHALSSAASAPAYNAIANHGVSCQVNFDARELERRLKALGSEERRKFNYTSPMLLSVAVPTPMVDEGMNLGIGRAANGDDGAEELPSLAMADSASGSKNYRGRSPLMDPDPYADGERPFVGFGLCRSIDESNRHSTSSSDTGFDRGSSSVWERDVFSITSDGSEAFTTMTYTDNVESMHNSRRRYRKLRERMSPSLCAAGDHMDNISSLSRFYVDHRHSQQEAELLAENDTVSEFYKDVDLVGDDDAEDGIEDSYSSRETGKFIAGSVWRASKLDVPDYEEMSDSISMHCDRDDLPSSTPSYDGGERKLSGYGDFSYLRYKEQLLSRRPGSDRPFTGSIAIREGEQESPPPNYTKFKLKQRACAQSKMRQSTYNLDPGLYNSVSLGQRSDGYDTIDSADMDSMASWRTQVPSTFDRHAHLHRRRASVRHIKSPSQLRAKAFPAQKLRRKASLQQDQGQRGTTPSSFERFPPSTTSGGGGGEAPPLTERDCSRVFFFDSFAMAKCSYEPKHDFKESMVEMVMEKDLRTSNDMVELLRCYLTLNADVYHDTIVKVFTEVWSEMFQHV